MTEQNTSSSMCLIGCIIAGLITTIIAWFLLSGTLGTFPLVVLLGMIFIGTTYFLNETFCNGADEVSSANNDAVEDKPFSSFNDDANPSALLATGSSSVKSKAAPKAASSKTSKSSSSAKSAKKPAAKKSAPVAAQKSSKASASKAASAKKPAAKKAAAKKTEGPELFTSKPSTVDDLKLISGVGPKLEGVLNKIGIYQYKQVANWKKADITFVDDRLKFKGRIERDDWVKQAKALAKGGEAEYIKVFGKKPR